MTTLATRPPLQHLAPRSARDVDAVALAAELRQRIRGEVRFDDGSRALYATDGSNYRQVPIGVVLPRDKDDVEARMSLCCGRPLYDFGMLDTAKTLLREILESLRPQICAGIPVVGLEPSCLAVFRDEMMNLFPNDEDAKKLSRQALQLGEFLHRHAPDFRPPRLGRKAIVHGHCHQRSVLGMGDEEAVLKDAGLDFEVLTDTCCGMAGSFGFEREHYEVSQAVGEHGVLPKVRRAGEDTLILTNGFSCRQQIEQATGRKPLHLAEVLRLALHEGEAPREAPRPRITMAEAVLGVGVAALGGWALGRWLTRRTTDERATAVRGPGVEDLRPGLRDGRRGHFRADRLREEAEAGGQPLHGDRSLP